MIEAVSPVDLACRQASLGVAPKPVDPDMGDSHVRDIKSRLNRKTYVIVNECDVERY